MLKALINYVLSKMEKENPFSGTFSLNIVALAFSDPAIEQHFTKERVDTSKPFIRLTCIIAILYYSAFLFLDVYLQSGILYQCIVIRGLVVSTTIYAIFKSYQDDFYKYVNRLLAFSVFCAGLGVLAIIAISQAPLTYLYYSGLIMVFIFAVFVNLKYQHSFLISVFTITIYNVLLFV